MLSLAAAFGGGGVAVGSGCVCHEGSGFGRGGDHKRGEAMHYCGFTVWGEGGAQVLRKREGVFPS